MSTARRRLPFRQVLSWRFETACMQELPWSSFHTLTIEHAGVRYVAIVRRDMPDKVYRFNALRDVTHERRLPLHEIESEYMRRAMSMQRFAIRSKWAARRRLKCYAKLWLEMESHASHAGD